MSIEFVWHNEHVGFGKQFGQKKGFCTLLMYCHVLNCRSCLIWIFEILGIF